jgi:hypothetical protein
LCSCIAIMQKHKLYEFKLHHNSFLLPFE